MSLSLHFTPWVALVLGILVGLVMEWVLELYRWRRSRLECQRRLAAVEAQLEDRETQIKAVNARIASLEADPANRAAERQA